MPDKVNEEEIETKVLSMLSNEPSEPVKLSDHDVYVVFQRPPFTDKYKARSWSSRKMKEFGYTNIDEEDPDLGYFLRSWGAVNTHVKEIYYFDEDGEIEINQRTYSPYNYNPETDKDYEYLLEKFAIEEYYNKGKSEDMLIASAIIAYTEWFDSFNVDGDDIKNS